MRIVVRTASLLALGLSVAICLLAALFVHASPQPKAAPGPEAAPQNISAAELQRLLAQESGKSDSEIARKLSGFELSERISDAMLESLKKDVPGRKGRSALLALADSSAFLPPPAADVLPQAAPDADEQQQMLARIVDYVGKTVPRLPNFYATQTVVHYRLDLRKGGRGREGSTDSRFWREIGIAKTVTTYRDGKEYIDPHGWIKLSAHPERQGMVTRGIFGPILSMVIADAARGEIKWARWERGSGETLAVFRYTVPQSASHYSVRFNSLITVLGLAGQHMAYHGEITADPATGSILRLTVEEDPTFGSPVIEGGVMVEYGPVEIGGRSYICPLRSVTISMLQAGLSGGFSAFSSSQNAEGATLLNHATFANYHLFRSEMRILSPTQ